MVFRILLPLMTAVAISGCTSASVAPDPDPTCGLGAKAGLVVGTRVVFETTVERLQYEPLYGIDQTSTTTIEETMTIDAVETVDGIDVYHLVFGKPYSVDTVRIAADDDSLAIDRGLSAMLGHQLPMEWLPIMSCSVGMAGRRVSDLVAEEPLRSGVGDPVMVSVRHRCEERWSTHSSVSSAYPHAIVGRVNVTDTSTILEPATVTFPNGTSQRVVETSLTMTVADAGIREWTAAVVERLPASNKTFCSATIRCRAIGGGSTP